MSAAADHNSWVMKVHDSPTGWYAEYLRSDRWQSLRRKVLVRAGGRCEGCLDAPATEVHHRTYEHVCKEFCFELVALCDACHRRVHQIAK